MTATQAERSTTVRDREDHEMERQAHETDDDAERNGKDAFALVENRADPYCRRRQHQHDGA